MSATSASTSTPLGKCVVCGKETWMRCSACSKAGLDWMCFCSIEHQKLIWFLHKRVCGERSNPFKWPHFTKEEIEKVLAYADKPFKLKTMEGPASWLDFLGHGPFTPRDVERTRQLRTRLAQCHTTDEVPSLRKMAFDVHVATLGYRGVNKIQAIIHAFIENPTSYIVSSVEHAYPKIAQESSKYQPWWTDFNHKYLHLVAVMHRKMAGSPIIDQHQFDELQVLIRYTAKEFGRFLRDEVSRTHPKLADQFVDSEHLMYGL